jgi:hypothetical protein
MQTRKSVSMAALAAICSLTLAACSSSNESEYPVVGDLVELGYGAYLGTQAPSRVEVDGEWTHHYFDTTEENAICLTGEPFQVSYRDGPSDEVLLYLQGGGACWDYSSCYVAQTASTTSNGPVPSGIIDITRDENPFRDFDIIYVPYCDGSVFIGDRIVDYDGQQTYHHGLRNLSVGVDAMLANFPNPSRIVVAGSSAGGYGTYAGYGVSRVAYPSTPILRFNDSGPGLQNKDATEDVQDRLKNWDFDRLIPASCDECDNQLSYIGLWAMERDEDLRTALYSYQNDGVISFFLDLPGDAFRDLLLDTTGDIQQRADGRYQRYLPVGGGHTVLLSEEFYAQEIGGVNIRDWTEAFLDDSPDWTDIVE